MYFRLMGKLNARRQNITEQNEKGFTLIELLVVVIIIGILAAIAIPVYLGVQKNSQDSSAQSDVTNAKTAIVALSTNNGTLPTTAGTGTDLAAAGAVTATPSAGSSAGTQSWSAAGVSVSEYTKVLKVTTVPAANTFCIVGTSNNGTLFYATDTSGTKRAANAAALPTGCNN